MKKHDLSSLRVLGSVGEPINPEAWRWYHSVVGKQRLPIVDTWWQACILFAHCSTTDWTTIIKHADGDGWHYVDITARSNQNEAWSGH